jgi:hypothetical protein
MGALRDNLESVRHFTALGYREALAVRSAAKRQHTKMARQPDLTQKRVRRATLASLRRFNKTLDLHIARMATTRQWKVVVLVTCVEAYLQDVLSAAARVEPTLMATSGQQAPYADVIAATSLEDLANELRARWARGWLAKGGPARWLGDLTNMGAAPYPDAVVRHLERMWGIRHVIVHRAGVADADFVKRHPGVVKAVGDRVRVSYPDIVLFLQAISDFVNPTDLYFLKRCPALLAPPRQKRTPGSAG